MDIVERMCFYGVWYVSQGSERPSRRYDRAGNWFLRFLKYASKKEQTKHSISNNITFRRTVNSLADEFISMAEDFDETPECFTDKRVLNAIG